MEASVPRLTFERQYRTSFSEGYHILAGERRMAHLDLHYTQSSVYATLVLEMDLKEEQTLDLLERIDESLVLSAEVPRDDLIVTVFRGRQTGFYTDEFLDERTERRAMAEGETRPARPERPERPERAERPERHARSRPPRPN